MQGEHCGQGNANERLLSRRWYLHITLDWVAEDQFFGPADWECLVVLTVQHL